MVIKGILFDVNGTLVDIHTDEGHDDIYRVLSNVLCYQGLCLDPHVLKDLYFQTMKAQRAGCGERHPEFDAVGIFREIIRQHTTDFTRGLSSEKVAQLPGLLAEIFRAASCFRLQLYPGVHETLRALQPKYHLAIVTDGQSAYALPELHAVGLLEHFDPIIVSGDVGYRKPDARLFTAALTTMKLPPCEVLYVGNDMYRDVYGAQNVGMKTVFFKSNQGRHEKEGVEPDYIIYQFPELLHAVRFFEDQ